MSYVNTLWVWDPSWVLYALEQPKMIRSHDYKSTNVMYNFSMRPLYLDPEILCWCNYIIFDI